MATPSLAPHVTVRRKPRKKPTVKYGLRPLSKTVKVPWAAALAAQHEELANSSQDGAVALELLQTGLSVNTVQNYDSKLSKFVKYCAAEGLTPMPATLYTILKYIGRLASEGTINVDSLQPYLSCINSAHESVGLTPPAVGPVIERARKGWRQRQEHVGGPDDKRIALPAEVMTKVLDLAFAMVLQGRYKFDSAALYNLRDAVAILVTYMFFGRSDTGHAAQIVEGVPDIQVHGTDLVFYERNFKGKAAGDRKRTLTCPLAGKQKLLKVISAFLSVAPATEGYIWRLPQDGRRWGASVIDDMMQRVMTRINVNAPSGYTYASHSLRKGAASAAFAVGVDIIRICYCGGWAQGSQIVYSYIDMAFQASPDGEYFFGHLRPTYTPPLGNVT